MDDALTVARSQTEESQAARMIYSTTGLFHQFIKGLDALSGKNKSSSASLVPMDSVVLALQDLIFYFRPPEEELEHEEKQSKLRSLKNRQNLFQEEGMITLVLDCVDRLNVYNTAAHFSEFAGEEAAESWKEIIRGNRSNCALFCDNLDWLVSKLDRLEASSGILEVLYCVLIESPEVLNIIQENHIKSIISLLDKHGRNHKVLDVLCSLCVCNGVAVRSNQNLITENLLPGRDLLLQTNIINYATSMRPNIFLGTCEGSTQYKEVGYSPYPGGGEGWAGNGVGDDLYSYGFDGLHLWLRFLLGGRHGDFKFPAAPGLRPLLRGGAAPGPPGIEPIKEYKHDFDGIRNLLGPTQLCCHLIWSASAEKLAEKQPRAVRDDNKKLHPCLVDFQGLPDPEKNYNLAMSGETLKTLLALGCHRNPRLVPYNLLDEKTKKTNRDTVCAAVRTLIGYGYNIEPPDQECSGPGSAGSRGDKVRIFRAEKSYVVTQGKWYFEFEAVTVGEMRVGWARPSVRADTELGADEWAYVFNGFKRWHVGTEPFGRQWLSGDVVGCMIDLTEMNIMFTLNGEMLICDSGSEMAFKDIEIGEGGRINLGQNVSSLRFFTICGLQEGFEPFAINMKRDITMWFSKSLPQFIPVPTDHPHLELSRVDGTVESAPCLKLVHKTFGSQNAATDLMFLRLSMPVEFHQTFKVRAGTTPLTRTLTVPEDEVPRMDPDSDYELLKKSVARREQEEEQEGALGAQGDAGAEERREREGRVHREEPQERAKKAALLNPPPVVPTMPRLVEDVVPDDRDDVDIILNTTTEVSGVWVGWITPDYHQYDPHFDLSKVRNVTMT
ncbi:hypothetical protein CRUP_004641, partial [Coryphaenoides rupestris]